MWQRQERLLSCKTIYCSRPDKPASWFTFGMGSCSYTQCLGQGPGRDPSLPRRVSYTLLKRPYHIKTGSRDAVNDTPGSTWAIFVLGRQSFYAMYVGGAGTPVFPRERGRGSFFPRPPGYQLGERTPSGVRSPEEEERVGGPCRRAAGGLGRRRRKSGAMDGKGCRRIP